MKVSVEILFKLYKTMILTRLSEERHEKLFHEQRLPAYLHGSLGQEAAGVAVSGLLRKDDYLFGTHRGMPEFLAKGMKLKMILAAYGGRATCLTEGKGGLHLCDAENGVMGLVGCLGSDFSLAVGVGLAIRNKGTDQVVVKYFGEGTSNQADFHPCMNMMALWKLPVIFVCANNGYTEYHPYRETTSSEDIAPRAAGYGIPYTIVPDGNDLPSVCEAMAEAIERARSGIGPTMLEFKTYRRAPHHTGDPCAYRQTGEMDIWQSRDPIAKCKAFLLNTGCLTEDADRRIYAEAETMIDEAIRFVEESPFPDPAEAFKGVFA
jgi:TPP-dependent pyruvate/acetoin dehydrogenase alpha subunit